MPDKPVFSGTLRECLFHYGNTLPTGGKKASVARYPMAVYTKADDHLIYRWVKGQSTPVGENLLLVIAWLMLEKKYQVTEFNKLPDICWQLIKLLVQDLITLDQMTLRLEYENRDTTLSVLRGKQGMSHARVRLARQLVSTLAKPEHRPEPEQIIEAPVSLSSPDKSAVLRALSLQVSAMLPLADLVLSDGFSTEDRRWLREHVPGDGLHTLAQILSGLCSAKSRDIVLQRQNQNPGGK